MSEASLEDRVDKLEGLFIEQIVILQKLDSVAEVLERQSGELEQRVSELITSLEKNMVTKADLEREIGGVKHRLGIISAPLMLTIAFAVLVMGYSLFS